MTDNIWTFRYFDKMTNRVVIWRMIDIYCIFVSTGTARRVKVVNVYENMG